MSLKRMIVSGAAALALMGTAATAANVQVAQDGTGDYLLTPVYYAVNNWSTELKVVNTNTTRAIVAKVVIRDSKECAEIMDFAIYLTPGDVWTGTLYDDNGVIKLKSTDDSMIIGGQVASPNNPIIIGVHPRRENPQNGQYHNENWHGYVEIFGMASYDPDQIRATNADLPQWTECTALDKLTFYNAVKDGQNIKDAYDAQDVSNDDLMGKATIYAEDANAAGRRYMSINMLALENFSEGAVFLGALGGETNVALMSSKGTNVLPEYDAALAKSNVYVMYEGDGNSVYPIRTHFTIPTKKYWFNLSVDPTAPLPMPTAYKVEDVYNDDGDDNPATNGTKAWGSEYYYSLNPTGAELVFRNNSEECNKCSKTTEVSGIPQESCEIKIHEEVHFFENANTNPADLYDSSVPYKDLMFAEGGYVDMNLADINYTTNAGAGGVTKTTSFQGLPVVPTTFTAKNVQGTILNNWLYNQYKAAPEQ